MIDIAIAIRMFFCAFFMHVLCHIVLRLLHKKSFFVVAIYCLFIPGLFMLFAKENLPISTTYPISTMRLPITAMILYTILSLLMTVLYLPFVLEGQVPSEIILHALQTSKGLTKKEIVALFSRSLLLTSRMSTLEKAGLIHQLKKNQYAFTLKGRMAYSWLKFTTTILGVTTGG